MIIRVTAKLTYVDGSKDPEYMEQTDLVTFLLNLSTIHEAFLSDGKMNTSVVRKKILRTIDPFELYEEPEIFWEYEGVLVKDGGRL